MPESIALYPGSFDPPTFGHLDLIERATKIFCHLIVAVTRNDSKQSLFSIEERVAMLHEILKDNPRIEIVSFAGLTADFARERGAAAIVRGLRAISDFEYEYSMALTNRKLNPDVDTVCLMPSEPYLFLSSRIVKEVARYNGDVSYAVPPFVAEQLRKKLGGRET